MVITIWSVCILSHILLYWLFIPLVPLLLFGAKATLQVSNYLIDTLVQITRDPNPLYKSSLIHTYQNGTPNLNYRKPLSFKSFYSKFTITK